MRKHQVKYWNSRIYVASMLTQCYGKEYKWKHSELQDGQAALTAKASICHRIEGPFTHLHCILIIPLLELVVSPCVFIPIQALTFFDALHIILSLFAFSSPHIPSTMESDAIELFDHQRRAPWPQRKVPGKNPSMWAKICLSLSKIVCASHFPCEGDHGQSARSTGQWS